jgi:hypothetical protein
MEDGRYKAAAAYRVRYLVDDIAASVPFHLGYTPAVEVTAFNKGPGKAGKSCSTGPIMNGLTYYLDSCKLNWWLFSHMAIVH